MIQVSHHANLKGPDRNGRECVYLDIIKIIAIAVIIIPALIKAVTSIKQATKSVKESTGIKTNEPAPYYRSTKGLVSEKCPYCGAAIDLKNIKSSKCPYCGSYVPGMSAVMMDNIEHERQKERNKASEKENWQIIIMILVIGLAVLLAFAPIIIIALK